MTDQTTPTLTPDPDGDGVILHLPEITHVDTQVWSADVGLTAAGLAALRTLLAPAAVQPPLEWATILDLMRDAESYLSALHGSVARHDHLAANLSCAGCELRQRIAATLPRLVAAEHPPVDRAMDEVVADARRAVHESLVLLPAPEADRARALIADLETAVEVQTTVHLAGTTAPSPVDRTALRDRIEVWPLTRVLAEVRCGSADWSWDEEWADLDQRHAVTGYLTKLEQQIRENGITMPVLIGSDGRLWDGHHRLRVAVRLGIGYVPVELTTPANAVLPEPADRAAGFEEMSPQQCPAGKHANWAVDSEQTHACPWCEAERLRAEWEAERRELNAMIRTSNAAAVEARADRAAVLREAAGTADRLSMEIEQAMKTREIGPLTALQDLADELRRTADEAESATPHLDQAARARLERLARAFEVSGNEFIAEQIRTALNGSAGSRMADDAQQGELENALADAEAEAERQLAAVQRVRHVLEMEPVLGRTALEYRGLVLAALMGDEAQPDGGEAQANLGMLAEAELRRRADEAAAVIARVRAITERAANNVQRPAARLARRILAELPDQDACPPRCPCHQPAAGARQDGAQP
ncbi:hypothetical protein [Streptomyces sp. PD-S100-1]|uniref:hypothetical protein n=1 Tax=Streptomyces sp. PD-S100-1 TaxID=3394351 RepID=UPI0039BCDD52